MQNSQDLVRTFHDIYNRRDWAKLDSVVAPELRFLDVPFGTTAQGSSGIKDFFMVWADAFPDSRAEINELHGADHHVTDVFTFKGTHTAPLRTPAGEVPATGKTVTVPGCFLFEQRGGKLVAARNYYDLATIMRQLGLSS